MSRVADPSDVFRRVAALFEALLRHDGFGDLRVEVRLAARGEKEVLVTCGKQYRFVVPAPRGGAAADESRTAAR